MIFVYCDWTFRNVKFMYVVLNNLNFKFIIQKRVFTFLIFPCVGIFWRDRRSQVWIKTGNKVEQRVWEDAEKTVYPVWGSLSTPREVPAGRSHVTPDHQNHSRIVLPPTIGLSYDWLTYLYYVVNFKDISFFMEKREVVEGMFNEHIYRVNVY